MSISAIGTYFLLTPFEGHDENGVINPTGFAVSWAFLPVDGKPTGLTTFYAGTWVTIAQPNIPTFYKTRVKVGPSGGVITFTTGSYDCWVKAVGVTESPVQFVGSLLVV